MLLCKNSRLFTLPVDNDGNFIFHLWNILLPFQLEHIPIPIPISSRKLLPFPMGIPWESHGNGNFPIPMHTSTLRWSVLVYHIKSQRALDVFWRRVLDRLITGMFGAGAFLIGLSYVDCTQTALAIVLLVLAVTSSGFAFSGYFVNHMDIAPQYAGTLMGLSSGLATTSGFIAPQVAFVLTESVSKLWHFNSQQQSWSKAYYTMECGS